MHNPPYRSSIADADSNKSMPANSGTIGYTYTEKMFSSSCVNAPSTSREPPYPNDTAGKSVSPKSVGSVNRSMTDTNCTGLPDTAGGVVADGFKRFTESVNDFVSYVVWHNK